MASGDDKDPFDRLLIAQTMAEGITLLSTTRWWRNTRGQCDWVSDH